MFGIDLGITVSSVTCVNEKNDILDVCILFGDRSIKNEWRRITEMHDAIIDAIGNIIRSNPGVIVNSLVALEEPIYPYRTRNPRSYFNLCCLYALTRNKLAKRSFDIYSVNPVSVKAVAKALAFTSRGKNVKSKYHSKGRLNKEGMIAAYKIVMGSLPDYHTKQGRETLADSFFIARTGLDRRKVGVIADQRSRNKYTIPTSKENEI